MKVIGICLVQNDDRFLGQVLENVIEFCDELILIEHRSTDKTPDICKHFECKYAHVSYHRIEHPSESHVFLEPYADTDSWVFGVDGDEIYDSVGLAHFKTTIGKWAICGQVAGVWESVAYDRFGSRNRKSNRLPGSSLPSD